MPRSSRRTRPAHTQLLQRQFGQRLRWLRLAWEEREPGKHSQEQWAEALGVHYAALSRWETGRYPMPPDLVWKIVMGMHATWDYLYGGLIGPGLEPWLAAHLRKRYPGALFEQRELRAQRDIARATWQLHRSRPARRRGRPPRKPAPPQPND